MLMVVYSCSTNLRNELSSSTEFRTETIVDSAYDEGELLRIDKKVNTIRKSDGKVIASLSQINNISNDYKTALFSGAAKEDGFYDYLLDSMSYDGEGNLVLQRMYVNKNGQWIFTQETINEFDKKGRLLKFTTERPDSARYTKQVISYKYNDKGLKVEESQFECSGIHLCDSVFKTKYLYNGGQQVNSTETYIWKRDKWIEFKRNAR